MPYMHHSGIDAGLYKYHPYGIQGDIETRIPGIHRYPSKKVCLGKKKGFQQINKI